MGFGARVRFALCPSWVCCNVIEDFFPCQEVLHYTTTESTKLRDLNREVEGEGTWSELDERENESVNLGGGEGAVDGRVVNGRGGGGGEGQRIELG